MPKEQVNGFSIGPRAKHQLEPTSSPHQFGALIGRFRNRAIPSEDPARERPSVNGEGSADHATGLATSAPTGACVLEQAEILQVAAASAGIGQWYAELPATEIRATGEYFRALGYEPGEIPLDVQSCVDRIHPEDRASILGQIEAAVRGEVERFGFDHRLRCKDGSYRWFAVTGQLFAAAAGDRRAIICGSLVDVTDLKRNEIHAAELAEAARHAGERLNALADNAPVALFELRRDLDGGLSAPYFSAKLPDLFGVTAADLAQDVRAGLRWIHRDDLAALREQARRSAEDLCPGSARFRLRHPERGIRWYLGSSLPTAQPDGTVLWRCSVLDITDEIAAERRAARASAAQRLAHERLTTLAENSPGALFSLRQTRDGKMRFPYFTSRLPDLMGVPGTELRKSVGKAFRHVAPEDEAMVEDAFAQSLGTGARAEFKFRVEHPQKGTIWLLCSASPLRSADGAMWYGYMIDITERLEMESRAALAAAEAHDAMDRLASIAEIAPVGLYEAQRAPLGGLNFTYTSAHFNDLMGFPGGDVQRLQTHILERIHPDDLPQFLANIETTSQTLTLRRQRFRIFHPVRGMRWLDASATPREGPDGVLTWRGALYDVTADVEREADLRRAHGLAEKMRIENERQALHDGLTALPNRRFYDRVLAERLAEAGAGGPRDCVLIRIDLDHFKYVNDTLGHEAGDQVLIRVAEVLRGAIRAGDFAARIGGDEFAILLAPGMTRRHAQDVVERVQARLAEPMLYRGRPCRFGASFGIALCDDICSPDSDIQLFADAALYRAKASGRSRMQFFTRALHDSILNDRRLAAEIHEALERDEFVPFFQPQVCAMENRLVGAETLLRWRHPTKGLLAPSAFMHLAEQLRLVPEIDRLMMEKSRQALDRWRAAGLHLPKISFNVSSGRMHDPDVVSAARAMRSEETKVTFELLESILVEEESDAFRTHLAAVREAGIDIEIDDFGSGHASIIGLLEIAPSSLKIDRRIVAPVARDLRSRNLVRAIVEIAEALGIGTVAEGVETPDQVRILRGLGCQVLQGYLYSRPVDEAGFLAYATEKLRRRA
ncbi:PAS domain S-box-containing protein/diguanylate cyclase (GGDEF)-like protein [Rhodovulum kholense]|uniref:PAS domain S-box-containing protein/diguanylate cyclase (GGDEF)-like protein n=1 Tax=Rhodovulum kholense TaxID=453584 RepID=A0A8E2VI44_9RHOB|nr:PAS domain S-box-containing protein/diguanylate cyclase (GGDEF)-like protein [Rhodovulum kholense]